MDWCILVGPVQFSSLSDNTRHQVESREHGLSLGWRSCFGYMQVSIRKVSKTTIIGASLPPTPRMWVCSFHLEEIKSAGVTISIPKSRYYFLININSYHVVGIALKLCSR